MIPAKIFMVWLGDIMPSYIRYAIIAYQKTNPTFDIQFIHYSLLQIEAIYNGKIKTEIDELMYKSIDSIINISSTYRKQLYRIMVNGLKVFYGKDIRAIQVLSDIFRLELINTYGGIYVDCDTFPMKSFDDKILSMNKFLVVKHLRIGNNVNLIRDNYFMGTVAGNAITNNNEQDAKDLLQTINGWWANAKFLANKLNFYKLKLEVGKWSLDPSFYIEHYCDGNWQLKNGQIRTQLCFLDKLMRH